MMNDQILETIRMIEEEKLDIRTVTMGISLLDCADSDGDVARSKIYDKITSRAKNLVSVCEGIEVELGIPIVNKRIAVTPISVGRRRPAEKANILSMLAHSTPQQKPWA